MTRRLLFLFVLLVVLAVLAPCAWCQFLSHEEREGMFAVSVGYTTREHDMKFRGASVPVEEIDAIFENFSTTEDLNSFDLSVAWISFGYVELRGIIGLVDHDLANTHSEDATFDTTFSSSGNYIYGVGATVRLPITDWCLFALDLSVLKGNFDDVEGDFSELDVVWFLTTQLNDVDWRELTITPMMLFRTGNFLPYAGLRLTDVTTEINTVVDVVRGDPFDRVIKYETENELSAVVGLTWRATPRILADFHAELFGNERLSLSVRFTF